MALENCCFRLMNTPPSCAPAATTTFKSNLATPFPRSSSQTTTAIAFKSKQQQQQQQHSISWTFRNRSSQIVCKASEAINSVQVVTDSNWETLVMGCSNPVLVEFWAPWCGPCRMIAPVIDELAKEYSGKISCYKLNTDDCPTIATKYGIRSIPTVLFFKNGERKESIIGAVPKTTLASSIEKYLDA